MANAIFVKFDGIDGECRESGHEGWIQVEAFSHHLAANIDRAAGTSSGSLTVGVAEHGDIGITKILDSSSLPIMAKCCAGQSFATVQIEMMAASSGTEGAPTQRFLGITLEKVAIANINYSDSAAAAGRPMENIELNYRKIEWTYTPYDDTGASKGDITKYWDLANNTGG